MSGDICQCGCKLDSIHLAGLEDKRNIIEELANRNKCSIDEILYLISRLQTPNTDAIKRVSEYISNINK